MATFFPVLGSFLFLATVQTAAANVVSLQNNFLYAEFNTAPGFPLSFLAVNASQPNLVVNTAGEALWSLQTVDVIGLDRVNAKSHGQQSYSNTSSSISFFWKDVALRGTTIDLLLNVSLAPQDTFMEFKVFITNNKPAAKVGLWQLTIAASGLTTDSDDTIFFPSGFGIQAPAAADQAERDGIYPSSGATMQFMAVGGGQRVHGSGVYVAAHDPTAAIKHVRKSTIAAADSPAQAAPAPAPGFYSNHPVRDLLMPSSRPAAVATTTLAFDIVVENAGLSFATYTLNYSVVVGVVARAPLWFGAAMIYRTWALAHAEWMASGPLSGRALPDWFLNTQVWANSGWQCHDVFNATQGDPAVVLPRLLALRRLLNLSLALHWSAARLPAFLPWRCSIFFICPILCPTVTVPPHSECNSDDSV